MNDDSQTFETADGTTVRADTLDSAHTVALLKALPTDDRENPGLHLPGRHFDIQRLRRALLEFEHEFDTDTAHLSFHSPKTSTAADHVLVLQPDESSQLGIGLAHKPPRDEVTNDNDGTEPSFVPDHLADHVTPVSQADGFIHVGEDTEYNPLGGYWLPARGLDALVNCPPSGALVRFPEDDRRPEIQDGDGDLPDWVETIDGDGGDA